MINTFKGELSRRSPAANQRVQGDFAGFGKSLCTKMCMCRQVRRSEARKSSCGGGEFYFFAARCCQQD